MTELKVGTKVKDRYTLKEFKGSGSFGEVWLAYDEVLDCEVAIKLYISLDSNGLEEFKSEYMTTHGISHPNLLTPNYFDIWEQRPYLVMKYCPKGSSSALAGEIDETDLWQFIHDMAAGLKYLHNLPDPIIHQDIKPDNILVDDNNHYLITDFGISKKIRSTMRKQSKRAVGAGATAYMGPERFDAAPSPVKASDIWSLGVSIYELATGELPFSGLGGGMQKNGAEIPNLDSKWSEDLNRVMQSCLAKETWDRPTADKLVEIAEDKINGKEVVWLKESNLSDGQSTLNTHSDFSNATSVSPKQSPFYIKIVAYVIGVVMLIACAIGIFHFMKKSSIDSDKSQNSSMLEVISEQKPNPIDTEIIEDNNMTPIESLSQAPENPSVQYTIKSNKQISENEEPNRTTKGFGNYSFGYADYRGELMNGKPHGKGRLTFNSSHSDNRLGYSAEAGDYIEGYFTNGSLDPGAILYKNDGTKKKLY